MVTYKFYMVRNWFRSIKPGVKNLIKWFPVIWKDRWWDHSYLYSILRYKLSLMEEGFRTSGISVNSEKDARNIKICILLLDRLIKDDYSNDYKKAKKLGKIKEFWEHEEMLINQDLDLLFKTMRKQIRSWWD